MSEPLDDLFYELKASGWQMHGLYEKSYRVDPPVGDENIKHWNCRIHQRINDWFLYAYGTGDTPAEAIRNALNDITRAIADHNRPTVYASRPSQRTIGRETVNVSLEDIGL